MEGLAHQDQCHHAREQEQQHGQVLAAIRIEDDVQPEEDHAQHAADDGAEKAVAAVQPGVVHVAAHAEDRADAGKGGVAVHQEVQQCAQGCRQGRFDVALAHVQVKVILAQIHADASFAMIFDKHEVYYSTDFFTCKRFSGFLLHLPYDHPISP